MSDSERESAEQAGRLLGMLFPTREEVIPGHRLWRLLRAPGRVLFLFDPALPGAASALADCAARELMRRREEPEAWTVRACCPAGDDVGALRARILAEVLPDMRDELRLDSLAVLDGAASPGVGVTRLTCVLDGAAAARFRRSARAGLPTAPDAHAWVSFWSTEDWAALDVAGRRAVLGAHDRVCSSDRQHPWRESTAEEALARPSAPPTVTITDVCPMRGWFALTPSAILPEAVLARPAGRLRPRRSHVQPLTVGQGAPKTLPPLDELIAVHLPGNAHFSEVDVVAGATSSKAPRLRRWDLDPRVVIIEAEWSHLEFGESESVLGRLTDGALVVDGRFEPAFVKLSGPGGHWFVEVRGEQVSIYEMEETAVDRR